MSIQVFDVYGGNEPELHTLMPTWCVAATQAHTLSPTDSVTHIPAHAGTLCSPSLCPLSGTNCLLSG